MGVERAVTRWYALCQNIQQEIDTLRSRLEQSLEAGQPEQERADAERQLVDARARLQALGPCPKAMMG